MIDSRAVQSQPVKYWVLPHWAGLSITRMETNGGQTSHYTFWNVFFSRIPFIYWISMLRTAIRDWRGTNERTYGRVNEAWWLHKGPSNESKWEVRGKKGPPSQPESCGEKWVAPPDGPPGEPGSRCQDTAVPEKQVCNIRGSAANSSLYAITHCKQR